MVLAIPCGNIPRAELCDACQPALNLIVTQTCGDNAARDNLPRLIYDIALTQTEDVLAQRIRTHAKCMNVSKQCFIFTGEPRIEGDETFLFHHQRAIARRQAIRLGAQVFLFSTQPRDLLF